jgi:hypothetical protein
MPAKPKPAKPTKRRRKLTKVDATPPTKEVFPPSLNLNMRRFLTALSQTGNVTSAAETSGLSRMFHYKSLRSSSDYAAAFALAGEIAVERLEAIARQRAIDCSDQLMCLLLRAAKPHVYGAKSSVDLTSNSRVEHTIIGELNDVQRADRIAAIYAKAAARRPVPIPE